VLALLARAEFGFSACSTATDQGEAGSFGQSCTVAPLALALWASWRVQKVAELARRPCCTSRFQNVVSTMKFAITLVFPCFIQKIIGRTNLKAYNIWMYPVGGHPVLMRATLGARVRHDDRTHQGGCSSQYQARSFKQLCCSRWKRFLAHMYLSKSTELAAKTTREKTRCTGMNNGRG
jgi:hypothetical protein